MLGGLARRAERASMITDLCEDIIEFINIRRLAAYFIRKLQVSHRGSKKVIVLALVEPRYRKRPK